MRMFIVGASGLVGKNLYERVRRSNDFYVIGTCHSRVQPDLVPFDIRLQSLTELNGPLSQEDCVVLCGAIVGNDKVLANPGMARKINVEGTIRCAEEALAAGSQVVFLSSDAVFDDRVTTGYDELSLPSPLTTYGKQKAEVENWLSAQKGRISIVRTGWVVGYEAKDHCPIRLVHTGMQQPDGMNLAHDLMTTLTDIHDLAWAIQRIAIAKSFDVRPVSRRTVFHIATNPPCSWRDIGVAVRNLSHYRSRMKFNTANFDELTFKEPRARSAWLNSAESCANLALQPRNLDAMIWSKVRKLDEAHAGTIPATS